MVDAAEDFSAAAGLQGSKHEEALAKLRTLKVRLVLFDLLVLCFAI